MKTVKIKIENLKCNGCASTIKKGLLKLDEVKNVKVNVEQSLVEVYFEGDDKTIDRYKKTLSSQWK